MGVDRVGYDLPLGHQNSMCNGGSREYSWGQALHFSVGGVPPDLIKRERIVGAHANGWCFPRGASWF